MAKNNNLHNAKRAKNDEFYTTRTSVERELCNYRDHFKGNFSKKVKNYFADSENCIIFVFVKQEQQVLVKV